HRSGDDDVSEVFPPDQLRASGWRVRVAVGCADGRGGGGEVRPLDRHCCGCACSGRESVPHTARSTGRRVARRVGGPAGRGGSGEVTQTGAAMIRHIVIGFAILTVGVLARPVSAQDKVSPEEAKATAELKKGALGVQVDEKHPDKPVISLGYYNKVYD